MNGPQELFDTQFELKVRAAVKGSETPFQAANRIKETLGISNPAHLAVTEIGEFQYSVLIKPYHHASHYSIICDR